MSGQGNTANAAPLALRLRTEADEWDAGEAIAPLLVEAAEAIELLAAELVLGRAALDAAEARAEEWRLKAVQRHRLLEDATDDAEDRARAVEARAERYRQALVEHHAVGALDGVPAGDTCPVCAALAAARQDSDA